MRPGEGAEQARAESQQSGAGERVLNSHHAAAENVVPLAVERDWPVQPEDHPHLEMILQVRADALGIVDQFDAVFLEMRRANDTGEHQDLRSEEHTYELPTIK